MPCLKVFKGGILVATDYKLLLFSTKNTETKEYVSTMEIVCVSVSLAKNRIALGASNKALLILDENLNVFKNLTVNRNISQLHFCNEMLLVADKAGDVYCYDLTKDDTRDLLLGHNSMILDLTTSHRGENVVTCDRDNKIRVSHFPNAYNIENYCLGHIEFVNNVRILQNDKILVSTSGDGTVRFWNYSSGKQLSILDTSSLVNKHNLEEFFKSLEDVSMGNALPIRTIEIFECEDLIYFAISLCSIQKIFLYKFRENNFTCELISSIEACPFYFCFFNGNLLYVKNSKLCCFKLPNQNNLPQDFLNFVNTKFCELNLDKVIVHDQVEKLYKRTFDNLKEYHENKKQRLHSE